MENKKRKLNNDERKRLIEALKRNSVIWDKTHPDHIKRNILKVAWDNVAMELGIELDLCKTGWKSIRDSDRYYKKKVNRRGGTRDVEYHSDNSDNCSAEPWEYTDEMKFLEEPRLSYSDILTPPDNMSPDPSTSSYSYRSNTPISRRTSCLNEPMFDVVDIVEFKKEKVDNDSPSNQLAPRKINNSTDLNTSSSVDISSDRSKSYFSCRNNLNGVSEKRHKTEKSENISFLNHLDFILHKLPIRASESLQAKIIAMAYEDLAKQREHS